MPFVTLFAMLMLRMQLLCCNSAYAFLLLFFCFAYIIVRDTFCGNYFFCPDKESNPHRRRLVQ